MYHHIRENHIEQILYIFLQLLDQICEKRGIYPGNFTKVFETLHSLCLLFTHSLIHSVLYSTDIYGTYPVHKTQQLGTAKYTKIDVTSPLPLINITLSGIEFELLCNWW